MSEPVELTNLSRTWSAEITSTHIISPRGARVTTQRLWEPETFLMLKSLRSGFWARARAVYWRSYSSRAIIGLEFIVQSGDWPLGNKFRVNLSFRIRNFHQVASVACFWLGRGPHGYWTSLRRSLSIVKIAR